MLVRFRDEELRFESNHGDFGRRLINQVGAFLAKDALEWCAGIYWESLKDWLESLLGLRLLRLAKQEDFPLMTV